MLYVYCFNVTHRNVFFRSGAENRKNETIPRGDKNKNDTKRNMKKKHIWTCGICGEKSVWGKTWRWFGVPPGRIIWCSQKCDEKMDDLNYPVTYG